MSSPSKKEIAKMIDHSLLHPTMDDQDLKEGIELALKYDVASVCIKPYAVKMAADMLKGSDVMVGTVIGFPHGNSRVDVKVFERKGLSTMGQWRSIWWSIPGRCFPRTGTMCTDEIAAIVAGNQKAWSSPEGDL